MRKECIYNMIDQMQKNCIGCKACKVICPVGAIIIKRDQEGFEYPHVLMDKCIKCGKCIQFCPVKEKADESVVTGKVFAARCKNFDILMKSSSGGIFSVLANDIINQNGVVYGVAFDEAFQVVYIRGEKDADIDRMRGSKYVDSFISEEIVGKFEKDVKDKRKVLFSGTSCQIAGMRAICKAKNLNDENVIFVDFYQCAGVVSSLLWKEECKGYAQKGVIEEISFRSKKNGWQTYQVHQRISGKSYDTDFLVHRWSKLLGNAACRRKTCIDCKYSCGRSGSDISIGDFWERDKAPKKYKDNKGLSAVKINTDKGNILFMSIQKGIDCERVELSNHFTQREMSAEDEMARNEFWKTYYEQGYEVICNKYARITWKEKILFGVIRQALVKLGIL